MKNFHFQYNEAMQDKKRRQQEMKAIRKFLSICVAAIICLNVAIVPTFAEANNTEVENQNEKATIVPYGAGHGSFVYPTNFTFTISGGSVDQITYCASYLPVFGKSGIIVLQFTNVATGDHKSWSMICDNGTRTEKMTYSLPAGTYRISMPVNSATLFQEAVVSFD